MNPAPAGRPTQARHVVIGFALTLAVLSYLSRVSSLRPAPDIMRDLHLTQEQMGQIFGAFGLSYALFEIPTGWLGDWIGPRRVLLRIVLWWSAFTALSGLDVERHVTLDDAIPVRRRGSGRVSEPDQGLHGLAAASRAAAGAIGDVDRGAMGRCGHSEVRRDRAALHELALVIRVLRRARRHLGDRVLVLVS